jgi:hypothetical protein
MYMNPTEKQDVSGYDTETKGQSSHAVDSSLLQANANLAKGRAVASIHTNPSSSYRDVTSMQRQFKFGFSELEKVKT